MKFHQSPLADAKQSIKKREYLLTLSFLFLVMLAKLIGKNQLTSAIFGLLGRT
jgi:hypothetical protein